jgi:hypothetical protein
VTAVIEDDVDDGHSKGDPFRALQQLTLGGTVLASVPWILPTTLDSVMLLVLTLGGTVLGYFLDQKFVLAACLSDRTLVAGLNIASV